MNGRQWMALMEAHFPEDLAESWDNVGLLCGDPDREVHSVYIALDATSQVVKDAVGCKADILLTHHPLIFSPLKRIVSDDFVGKRLIKLMENHMIYYAMHTNYDIRRMADIASERLDLTDPCPLEAIGEAGEGIGRTGDLKEPLSLADCARFVKKQFQIPDVRIFGDPDQLIRRVSVCPGSGKGMEGAALGQGADALIAGDFGHHDGIDAVERGLAVIDAGHYGLEHVFVRDMEQFMAKNCPELTCFTSKIQYPFQTL